MRRYLVLMAVAAVISLAVAGAAEAQPVGKPINGADGNIYVLVAAPGIDYATAIGAARKMSYGGIAGDLGVPANLATLVQLRNHYGIAAMDNVWLGGVRLPNGVWSDLLKRPLAFLPFAPGENNNFKGKENALRTVRVPGHNDYPRYGDISLNHGGSGFLVVYRRR